MPDTEFPSPQPERRDWPWSVQSPASGTKSNLPRITIVTPSFNQGAFLEETIRSVLLQGYDNLEYLIVDGGSTDNSLEIIRRYEPWISWWTSERDDGQADAINKGFSRATGAILGWLNSDDVLYPGFLEARGREFEAAPDIDMIYGDVETGVGDASPRAVMKGRQIDFETMVRTLKVPIPQQSALWRRGVLDRVGDLDSRWQVVLDRDFFLRVARYCSLAYRPGVVGLFRLHPESKSEAGQLAWVEELPQLYHELFADPDLPPDIAQYKNQSMVAMERLCAQLLWRHHHFEEWSECIFRAARRSPRHFGRLFLLDTALSKVRGTGRRIKRVTQRGAPL
ncbi:MAG: glycosyltransferase [Thermoanaerobaculales bacterium]|nr:glycosyltransferase [Thermoanaerobaculales bacterium]